MRAMMDITLVQENNCLAESLVLLRTDTFLITVFVSVWVAVHADRA